MSGGLSSSRIEGTKGPVRIQSRVTFPFSLSSILPSFSRQRSPFSFFFLCFLPPFLPRCRPVSPVNVASHVVSEGFCESADDCRRVIRRFLAWRQPLHRGRKGACRDGYDNGRKREIRSRPREARLDAAPEGLSVTNDRGAMHTQIDRETVTTCRGKREKKAFYYYLPKD